MLFKKKTLEKGVCFFDIDGVLNVVADWHTQYTFRPDMVANLCTFVKEKNLDLVMMSSWRTGFKSFGAENNLPHVKQLERELHKYNVEIKGKTPIMKGRGREEEIESYLSLNPYDRCFVLDHDVNEYSSTDSYIFFFTDSGKGFDKEALKNAMKLI